MNRQYLSSEISDDGKELGKVFGHTWRSLLIVLPDLQLQLPVGCLQGAHLHTEVAAPCSDRGPTTCDRLVLCYHSGLRYIVKIPLLHFNIFSNTGSVS